MIRSTHSLPEVRTLSPRRRNVLTNAAGNTWWHNLHFWSTVFLAFAMPPLTAVLAQPMLLPSVIVSLLAAALYFPVGALLLRSTLRRIMVNRRKRPFVCFDCGYRLIGLPEPRCPECGRPAIAPDSGRLRRAG